MHARGYYRRHGHWAVPKHKLAAEGHVIDDEELRGLGDESDEGDYLGGYLLT